MKRHISTLFILSLFVFISIGAGCNPDGSPVALNKYQAPVPSQGQSADSLEVPEQTNSQSAYGSQTEQPEVPAVPVNDQVQPTNTSTNPSLENNQPPIMENTQPEILAFPGILPESELANKQVRIKTAKGDIVFELLPKEGPKAASNYYYLANKGFYNGLNFHRVEPGFVIQGGDPLGNGTGGPGYKFEDDKVNLPYNEGIVAMANAGPNTNGSQFFIMLGNTPLPPSYSIFGKVISGLEVVKKIAVGDVMDSVQIEPLSK